MAAPVTAKAGRVWYRRPAGQITALALYLVMLPVFATIVFASSAGAAQIGLILGGIEVVLGAALLAVLSPLIMLSTDAIRIWHGFRFTNIGISEIAGVGMLYARTTGSPKSSAWRVTIWRENGSFETTGLIHFQTRHTKEEQHWEIRWGGYDPVAPSQIPALNACRAAAVSRDICNRVTAAQGPHGQLRDRHLEKVQPRVPLQPYTEVIAYWSPDGEYGHCQ